MVEKKFWRWTLIFILSCLIFPQTGQAMGLEAAIGVWMQNPQGGGSYKGDSLDLQSDLKFSSANRIFGRAKIELPLIFPNLYLMATPMNFDGTGNKNVSFTFGNQTFNANVPFSSNLKLDHYDLAFYYGIPALKQASLGMFNLDLGLNVRIYDFKAEISQSGNSESKWFYIPVPMAYLGLQVKPINALSLEGEIRGMAYNGNQFFDLIGRVKYSFLQYPFISAGYRHQSLVADQSDVKLDVKFSGPFLEAGLQF